jgi:TrmH family RNA methyltransferase
MTLVDGAREVLRAIEAGVEVEEVFVCQPLVSTADGEAALAAAATRAEIVDVGERAFERLAFGERAEGVIAVVRPPSTDLDRLDLPHDPLVVVVEGVEKPGNLGAILRSADGAGVDALIAADPRTDLFNPNAIRASLGTIFALPLAIAGAGAALEWLAGHGIRPIAARVDAARRYTEADLTGAAAIVLGSEAEGLTDAWRDPRVEAVRLPMHGVADSLNVAATAAVLLYEARRQRDVA